jgi:hypothetical protein
VTPKAEATAALKARRRQRPPNDQSVDFRVRSSKKQSCWPQIPPREAPLFSQNSLAPLRDAAMASSTTGTPAKLTLFTDWKSVQLSPAPARSGEPHPAQYHQTCTTHSQSSLWRHCNSVTTVLALGLCGRRVGKAVAPRGV